MSKGLVPGAYWRRIWSLFLFLSFCLVPLVALLSNHTFISIDIAMIPHQRNGRIALLHYM